MNLIRYLRRVDSTLFLTVISLGIICLMIIGSATHANVHGYPERYDFILKQGIFLVLGIIISGFTLKYDYRILYKWAPTLFVINALSLIVVKFAGTSALGAQRWIQIGSFTLQPSEFAKLFMIICLARLLSNRKQEYKTWRSLLPVAGLMTLPTFLIFIQPDLGTSLVFCAITLGMLYICGLSIKLVKQALIGLLVISPIVWFFVLHEYQKMRLLVLFNPNVDPYGSGYHVIQSKISIGSGGFIGPVQVDSRNTEKYVNFVHFHGNSCTGLIGHNHTGHGWNTRRFPVIQLVSNKDQLFTIGPAIQLIGACANNRPSIRGAICLALLIVLLTLNTHGNIGQNLCDGIGKVNSACRCCVKYGRQSLYRLLGIIACKGKVIKVC